MGEGVCVFERDTPLFHVVASGEDVFEGVTEGVGDNEGIEDGPILAITTLPRPAMPLLPTCLPLHKFPGPVNSASRGIDAFLPMNLFIGQEISSPDPLSLK